MWRGSFTEKCSWKSYIEMSKNMFCQCFCHFFPSKIESFIKYCFKLWQWISLNISVFTSKWKHLIDADEFNHRGSDLSASQGSCSWKDSCCSDACQDICPLTAWSVRLTKEFVALHTVQTLSLSPLRWSHPCIPHCAAISVFVTRTWRGV